MSDAQNGEPTVLEWRYSTSGLPSGPYSAWKEEIVNPYTGEGVPDVRASKDYSQEILGEDNPAFRWVRHKSGPPAAIFTCNINEDGTLRDVGGGRDCPRNENDLAGGYFSPGYFIRAVSGFSCGQLGIPLCQGAFCY